MSLIDEMMDICVFLNRSKVSDGEGGFKVEWSEGAEFRAAIVRDSTMTARIAEKEGVSSVYTITTRKSEVELEYHDVIKRRSDGLILRATSDCNNSPSVSTLDMCQVNAEKWELTQ